jgi:hypothetical protein
MKICKFTGYTIKKDRDLNNLKKYWFIKTEPKDTNPWRQRQFNINWNRFFGTWETELLVSKEDRKLLSKCEEDANIDGLTKIIQEMIIDGVFEQDHPTEKGGEQG